MAILCCLVTAAPAQSGNFVYTVNGTDVTITGYVGKPAEPVGPITIPAALSEIAPQAFQLCGKLRGVTFHSGVTSLGNKAVSTCGKLLNAVFAGNPPTMGSGVFELVGSGVAIYFLTSGTGFTLPSWMYDPVFELSYPAFYIEAVTPEFTWLYDNNLPGSSDFLSDANGDGVSLLMAYALNMDPNARDSPPQPVFAGNQMCLSFYANTPGVSYAVRTSDDMVNWSADEVPLSGPVTNRTATVSFSGPQRFMRLEMSH